MTCVISFVSKLGVVAYFCLGPYFSRCSGLFLSGVVFGSLAFSNEGSLVCLVGSIYVTSAPSSIANPSPSWHLRSEWLLPVLPPFAIL